MPEWAQRIVLIINNFFQVTYAALNRGLTIQDNFSSQIVELQVNGDNPTLTFENKLQRNPLIVLPVQVLVGAPSGAVTLQWRVVNTAIEVTEITGLAAGVQYTLRLLIV